MFSASSQDLIVNSNFTMSDAVATERKKKKSRISASESSHTGMSLWRNTEARQYWPAWQMESSAPTFTQLHIPGVAGKETFKKVKVTDLFYFSPLMWKVYRNMRFVSSVQAHWHSFSDFQLFQTFCCETQGTRDMLEIFLQSHLIWVLLPLTKLGNFEDIFLISSQWQVLKSTETEPGFVNSQWKHTHTHRAIALGSFPESQKATIHLAIFLSLNVSLILWSRNKFLRLWALIMYLFTGL